MPDTNTVEIHGQQIDVEPMTLDDYLDIAVDKTRLSREQAQLLSIDDIATIVEAAFNANTDTDTDTADASP